MYINNAAVGLSSFTHSDVVDVSAVKLLVVI